MRDLTQAMIDETQKSVLRPIYLYKGHFDSQLLCLCTGTKDIDYDGDTYLANGWLRSVPTLADTHEIRADPFTVQLFANDPSVVSLLLNESNTGMSGKFFVGFLSNKTGRENLLKKSNTFSDALWTKTNVAMSGDSTDVFGSGNAWLMTADGAGSIEHTITQTITGGGSGSPHLYQRAFLKFAGERYIALQELEGADNVAIFDLINGAVAYTENNVSANITPYANGWYLCEHTFVANSSDVEFGIAFRKTIAAAAPDSFTVSGLEKVYIGHCQVGHVKNNSGYIETPAPGLGDTTNFAFEGVGKTLLVDPDPRKHGQYEGATTRQTAAGVFAELRYASRFVDFNTPREHRLTHENQLALYPGDKFLEHAHETNEWNGFWGIRTDAN